MKYLFLILLVFQFKTIALSQWISVHKDSTYKFVPLNQFVVNPYTNDLWFVQAENVHVIKNDGTVKGYTSNELGELYVGMVVRFTFTPDSVYFYKNNFGLFQFFNNSSTQLYQSTSGFYSISNNIDSVYVGMPSVPYLKSIGSTFFDNNLYAVQIIGKNQFIYKTLGINSALVKYFGSNQADHQYYSQIDDEYICPQFHDIKFSRHTDTLYVSCKQGICFAYNYDFLDTITPFNTVNMPSPNVLEMEFDHLDRLWAVFGDENDQAFSIAMLDGNTWTNYYDAANSPIRFVNSWSGGNAFRGMEIDTLGNVWVCDNDHLHTLLNPNTPEWVLNTKQLDMTNINIFPNPTSSSVHIDFGKLKGEKELILYDLSGQLILKNYTQQNNYILQLERLSKGIYILSCEVEGYISKHKLVLR
jgi:hypothetical protein